MWKLLLLVAAVGQVHDNSSASSVTNGFKQTGAPFHFQKTAVIPERRTEDNDTVWWPAKGRPPKLRKPAHARLPPTGFMHTVVSFPNPFTDPGKCVSFENVSHAWVCDPDKLLNPNEQADLEAELMRLRDITEHSCGPKKPQFYQAAVAVAMDIVVPENQTPQEATDHFAQTLLRQWGVGNRGCHDGILLFYVKNLGTSSLATREAVDKRVSSDEFKLQLRHHIHSTYLVTGSVAAALKSGVGLVTSHLPVARPGIGVIGRILILLFAVYALSVVAVYFLLTTVLTKRYASEE